MPNTLERATQTAGADRERKLREAAFVSVCGTMHNEIETVEELVSRIAGALEKAGYSNWEAVLVDDGSDDGTAELLDRMAAANPRVVVVHHETNRGEWAGWKSAFAATRGDVVCLLAGDLQTPPEELPKIIDLVVIDGFDLGSGRRTDRKDDLLYRYATKVLTAYSRVIWGVGLRDVTSAFFAVRGDIARKIKMLHNDHRYIMPIFKAAGASMAEIDTLKHQKRVAGQSHYKKSKVITAIPEVLRFTVRFYRGYYS